MAKIKQKLLDEIEAAPLDETGEPIYTVPDDFLHSFAKNSDTDNWIDTDE